MTGRGKDKGLSLAQQYAGGFTVCAIVSVTAMSIACGHVTERKARSLELAQASTLRMAALRGEVVLAHFAGDVEAPERVTLAE